jgi:protocatechuate 3,4-dioxygenase beta subunit
MKRLFYVATLSLICSSFLNCNGQSVNDVKINSAGSKAKTTTVGGSFENREYTYQGIPKVVSETDTSAGWKQPGDKLLVTGTVYKPDGKTPAPGVLLYYYQTDVEGRYVHKSEEIRSMAPNNLGQTHGYIRGWVKTDSNGNYFIYTVRPGIYPTHDAPAHIHVTVKEPNDINEYYIDDFVFDDDKLLNLAYRKKMENRAGSGVLRLVKKGNLFIGERNIVLGLNIPDYPHQKHTGPNSGKNIAEDVFSFTPYHAWGPDKGSKTCPMCKYGWFHGILYFVGNKPNWEEIRKWLTFFEKESEKRENYLKVYFVYGNENAYNPQVLNRDLEEIGRELGLERVALTYVPSFSNVKSDIYLNKINPDVGNTILLYKRGKIIEKFIDLKPSEDNYLAVANRLDKTINEYFFLGGRK